jgi:ParB-like chromosome segregation protein Spo0J
MEVFVGPEHVRLRARRDKHGANSKKKSRTHIIREAVGVPLAAVRLNPRNARTHSKKQIGQIAESIKAFGFTSPLIVDEGHVLIAGHGRKLAAEQLGLTVVPTIIVEGLTESQKRALMLADNRITQNAGWDREICLRS